MAFIGDKCVYIGSPDWFIGDPLAFFPNAEVTPAVLQYAQYHTARVDASASYTEDPLGDVFYYVWSLVGAPDGVDTNTALRTEVGSSDEVALLPMDKVGVYRVQVQVLAANGGCSAPSVSILLCQPAIAAQREGGTLSTEWLWAFLPDFWGVMSEDDRAKIETLWRGMHQLVASDIMSVLNARDATSIATIQERVLRRWVPIDLTLPCEGAEFMLRAKETIGATDVELDVLNTVRSASATITLAPTTTISDARLLADANGFARRVLLGQYDGQSADIGASIIYNLFSYNVVAINSEDSGRVSLVLDQVINKAPSDDVSVTLTRKGASEFGSLYAASGAAEASYAEGTLTFRAGRISYYGDIDETQIDLFRGTQLRLRGAEYNGVSVGDLIDVQVTRADALRTTRTFDFTCTVVGVTGDYVSVDLDTDASLNELVADAVAALEGPTTPSEYVTTWITRVQTALNDSTWRARFLNSWMTSADTLEFGTRKSEVENDAARAYVSEYRAYRVTPVRVVRRSRVNLPQGVSSIFRLQERTEAFAFTQDGVAVSLANRELPHEPRDRFLNLHYTIRGNAARGVGLELGTLPNELTTQRFDFVLSRVEVGDTLRMDSGPSRGTYTILAVQQRSVYVTPLPPNDFYNQTFTIVPNAARGDADILTFAPNVVPAHVRTYWAETALVDNSATVESQFGHLVGLRLDEWAARGLTNSYKDAVSGMMFARMFAPTIANMTNAVSLLAGVPFAYTRSQVQDIIDDYEIDARTGAALQTRVQLVELDDAGVPTGVISAYTFPAFRAEDRDPDFSGIARGSDGQPLRVNSVIEQYTALALGVKISDIYNSDAAGLSDVRDRHRFRVQIDVDSAQLTEQSLRLIYDFVLEVKPAYTAFLLRLRKFLVDYIHIEDEVFFKLRTRIFDNPYHIGPQPNIFDAPQQSNDVPTLNPLTTWFPRDGVIYTEDGSSLYLSSLTGGFVDPRGVDVFSDVSGDRNWPQQWIMPGDVVLRRDIGETLVVSEVIDDSTLRLAPSTFNTANEPAEDMPFIVARPQSAATLFNEVVENIPSEDDLSFAIVGYIGNDIGVGDYITLEEQGEDKTAEDATGLLQVTRIETQLSGRLVLRTLPRKPPSVVGACRVRVFHERDALRRPDIPEEGISLTRVSYGVFTAGGINLAARGITPGLQVRLDLNAYATVAFVSRQYVAFTEAPVGERVTLQTGDARAENRAGADAVDTLAVDSGPVLRLKNVGVRVTATADGVTAVGPSPVRLFPGDLLLFSAEDTAAIQPYGAEEGSGVVRVGPVTEDRTAVALPCAYDGGPRDCIVTLLRQGDMSMRHLYIGSVRDAAVYGNWVRVFTRDLQE